MKTAADLYATQAPGAGGAALADRHWLRAHLDDPMVRVVEVDVSPAAYNDWHIDGAVLWNIYGDLKDADYRTVGSEAVQALLTRSGIGPDSTVVFYGYAPAFGLWLMRRYGHRDVRILDCSRETWRAEGYPWASAASQPGPGTLVLDGEESGLRADQADVLGWLVVEPYAEDDVTGNLNPVGRVYYSASTQLCVPNALSQPGGYALGAQAGEAAIRELVTDAGFTRFRRAAQTPFNLVYEARP